MNGFGKSFLCQLGIGVSLLSAWASPRADTPPLYDPTRPVMELGRDYAVLQYYTAAPCETRVQLRESNLPAGMTRWV